MPKEYIRRTIFTDWSLIDPSNMFALNDHYSSALAWLESHDIYTSDLTSEGLMGMVASHAILFEYEDDLLAFTLVYGDLMQ